MYLSGDDDQPLEFDRGRVVVVVFVCITSRPYLCVKRRVKQHNEAEEEKERNASRCEQQQCSLR